MTITVTPAPARAGWFTARVLFIGRVLFETSRPSEAAARQAAQAWMDQAR